MRFCWFKRSFILLTSLLLLSCGDDTTETTHSDAGADQKIQSDQALDVQNAPREGGAVDKNISDQNKNTDGKAQDGNVTDGPMGVPANASCAQAEKITISGGVGQANGYTTQASNEFDANIKCGLGISMKGPQVYYKADLKAGKTYRATVTPASWAPALYAFPAAKGCSDTGVEAGCAGNISISRLTQPQTILLSPTSDGEWIFVVDSEGDSAHGTFALKIEEVTLPQNSTCLNAKAVTLTNGKATETGDTALSYNEFGDQITCGNKASDGVSAGPAYYGTQIYYEVDIKANTSMKLTLKSQINAFLVVFPKSINCDAAKINEACGVSSTTGAQFGYVETNKATSYAFSPSTPGKYIVAVEGYGMQKGSFELTFEETTPPTHSSCDKANEITMTNGLGSATGNTFSAANQYSIMCGGSAPFIGPQLFYKVKLDANEQYKVELKPNFDAELYLFSAAANCKEDQIEAACKGGSTEGLHMSAAKGTSQEKSFSAPSSGYYFIAVDSVTSSDFFIAPKIEGHGYGSFDLKIRQQSVATLQPGKLYDFEQDDAGLLGSKDWEWGAINFNASSQCQGTPTPPSAGHSGKGMWGTVLNDCHSLLNNKEDVKSPLSSPTCSNVDPNDDAILKFKVDLTSCQNSSSIELSFWSWDDFRVKNWAEVRVEGASIHQLCKPYVIPWEPPTSWTNIIKDLTPYKGKTIEIAFHYLSTVDWATECWSGWYIDDLQITCK